MRALIQRVKKAHVAVNDQVVGSIEQGLLVFLGIEDTDNAADEDWLARKILNLRLFDDAEGQMNLSVLDTAGSVLLISQFTLHANIKKGNRPSYNKAAKPKVAIPKYEAFTARLKQSLGELKVQTGEFGAHMQVHLLNDGPVTIWADSKNKEGL